MSRYLQVNTRDKNLISEQASVQTFDNWLIADFQGCDL